MAGAALTRKQASGQLLDICRRPGGEVDGFLAEVESKLGPEDFRDLREMVGAIMGNGFFPVMTAIGKEFPELAPEWTR